MTDEQKKLDFADAHVQYKTYKGYDTIDVEYDAREANYASGFHTGAAIATLVCTVIGIVAVCVVLALHP